MTKEEILQAIRVCATNLKRNPSLRDLRLTAGISEPVLYKHFGSFRHALEAAGLQASGPGFGQRESTLLLDWATVARKLRKLPSVHEYESAGRFSNMPFHTRYHHWTRIPEAFCRFAQENALQSKWKDVFQMCVANPAKTPVKNKTALVVRNPRRREPLPDRPVYGRPLLLPELAYEPMNELGVVFIFGVLAHRLGFVVQRLHPEFPDCEAMREMAGGRWQRVRIEFEFESRSFRKHRHKPELCDMIVCWKHNWPECPSGLEVLELSRLII